MEPRTGGAANPRGNRGVDLSPLPRRPGPLLPAGPSARQRLARLDSHLLAAEAATVVAALVHRAGATFNPLAFIVLGCKDNNIMDSCLPH
ncbi:hypothetical protein H8957_016501, partial [Semnopithecus entellus]